MRVRATRMGYYEHRRRREGHVFDLTNAGHFTSSWMERVDESGKALPPPEKPKKEAFPQLPPPQSMSQAQAVFDKPAIGKKPGRPRKVQPVS